MHIDDGRPKALQLETAAIEVSNFSLDTLLKEETFNSATKKFKAGWLFTTPQTQFPHFDCDLTAIPDRLKELLNYRLRMQMSRQQGGSPVNVPLNSELSATEGWHVHTSCVHVAFVESYTHEATLYTKTFIQDFPLHFWVFLPTEHTASPSPSSDQKEPTFSFIAHAPDVIHAELERLQLLFIMRLKDSFTDFKYSLTKFLTLKSLDLPMQEPVSSSEDLAEAADQLTTPTSSEEGEERKRGGAAEREEGEEREKRGDVEREEGEESENGGVTERTPSRSSNKLKDISASIGGCVIVHSIVADIILPSLYTAGNSREATKLPILEEVVSPTAAVVSEAGLVSKTILPSNTPSPKISPSGSQSSLTGSHVSSSTLSSSIASLPVVSEPTCPPTCPATPPPQALTYSHHYSSAVNVRVAPAAKMQHLRSLSTSNLPTVTYVGPSTLSSIPSPPAHPSPSPLSCSAMRADSNPAETSSSTTVVQEHKASEDVSISSSSSALTVNVQETDSKPSSVHSSTSDIPSSAKDGEIVEGFVLVDSPASVSSKSSVLPDSGHTDSQIRMPDNLMMQMEPGNLVAGTESLSGSQTKEVDKTEQCNGSDRSRLLKLHPESRQNGSRSPSRASSRVSIGSKRAKSPSPIHVEPKHVMRIHVEHLYALPTVQASSSDITVRASVGHLKLLEIEAKKFDESRNPFGNSRRSGRTEEDQDEGSNPVIKVRFELGNQVKRYFPNSDIKNIDAIVVAAVEGLTTGLLAPNGPLLKDFFSDEYETDDPIPIHLRFGNTDITLKDELQHTADDWTSLTIHVDHANLRRGRKVEGVDLFLDRERLEELGSSETLPCEEEEADSSQSNRELLQSFRSFIDVFEAHVSRHGQRLNLPRPDHVAGLLHELRSSLVVEEQVATVGAPPSYSEAISETTRSRSQSIAAEIQRLRRENEELKKSQSQNEHLVSELTRVKNDMVHQLSDFEMVTEECKKVKEQLVAYKQVIEKQQLQIESLAYGHNVDTRMLSTAYHPPH